MKTNNILAISGNDIFSGGGLYADLNTFAHYQLHGFLTVTCLTAMTKSSFEVFGIDKAVFKQQLDSLKTVPFEAIKIGLLPNVELAEITLDFIKGHTDIPVILDPVLVCKEKRDVAVSQLRDELLKFFPYVTLITPNLVEAELLAQKKIRTVDDMKLAAQKLYALGARQVVIKGGNRLSQEMAIDLYYDGTEFTFLESDILEENNIGAGCTFASGIASQLALGISPLDAVRESKSFVYQAILHSDQYGVKQIYDEN